MSEEESKLEEAHAQVAAALQDPLSLCRAQQTAKWRDDPLAGSSNCSKRRLEVMAACAEHLVEMQCTGSWIHSQYSKS
jgi:hypothetical protein